jgi:hypothetical protein
VDNKKQLHIKALTHIHTKEVMYCSASSLTMTEKNPTDKNTRLVWGMYRVEGEEVMMITLSSKVIK